MSHITCTFNPLQGFATTNEISQNSVFKGVITSEGQISTSTPVVCHTVETLFFLTLN